MGEGIKMSLKVIDGTPTAISKFLREQKDKHIEKSIDESYKKGYEKAKKDIIEKIEKFQADSIINIHFEVWVYLKNNLIKLIGEEK